VVGLLYNWPLERSKDTLEDGKMDDAPVYLIVAAFGELHSAENALNDLQAAPR
jgi:hypothetical protein